MPILHLLSFLFGGIFAELGLLIGSNTQRSSLSSREYLILESQYHPSWIVRSIFRYMLAQMSSGKTLAQILQKIQIPASDHVTTLNDLQPICQALGASHPVVYPSAVILRLVVIVVFSQIISFQSLNIWTVDHGVVVLIGIMVLSLQDIWGWLSFKVYLVELYFFERDPSSLCQYSKSLPIPQCIRTRDDRKLWTKIWKLEKGLDESAKIFATYWKYHATRKAALRRKIWTLLAQFATFFLFLMTIQPVIAQLYGGNHWF